VKLRVDLDLSVEQADNIHGQAGKDMIVLHETVSGQAPESMADIRAVSHFLDVKDYGIHGIVDNDGYVAWAYGEWDAVFWHTASQGMAGGGAVNRRAIGIEQISRVMLDYRSRTKRWQAWLQMKPELHACAKLIAAICNTHKTVPLRSSSGRTPGIVTHWEVTQQFQVPGGHTDCWPHHLGGYYPKLLILDLAARYKKLGYRL